MPSYPQVSGLSPDDSKARGVNLRSLTSGCSAGSSLGCWVSQGYVGIIRGLCGPFLGSM